MTEPLNSRRTRHLRALGVALVAILVAAAVPYRVFHPEPDVVTSGGSLGREVLVHQRQGVASLRASSVEWVTTFTNDQFAVMHLQARGEWGSLALGRGYFTVLDSDGQRHGPTTKLPPELTSTPWREGWIHRQERWRGALVFPVAKQQLILEVYDVNAHTVASLLIPDDADTTPQQPSTFGPPIRSAGEALPIHAGGAVGLLRIGRVLPNTEPDPVVRVRFSLQVQHGSFEPDATWFVQHPATAPAGDGFSEEYIPIGFASAPRGPVSAGQTVYGELLLRQFEQGSLITVSYEYTDIGRILLPGAA